MIALLQRVACASVMVNDRSIAAIDAGLCVFIGVEKSDAENNARRMARRLCSYRVFPDEAGRMNLSIQDTHGELLLVPNFTLAADTRKGTRASFTPAAPPELAEHLFDMLGKELHSACPATKAGQFGANMQVELVNDGPATFLLRA
ncbi:MAG: D-aminoacyl-tRNA deacylase [Mariprofundaceae bacterium]|nr:D-aminoacyl-tRNA deacylase [Mariprofundaceae bacterium]